MSKPCLLTSPPTMFVGKVIGHSRIDHFMKNKYIPLCNTIGKLDTCFLFYTTLDFTNMMRHFFNTLGAEGVRIYIASYSGEGSDSVPREYGDQLTLIFAPTRNTVLPADLGLYYSIPPQGHFDPAKSQLDKGLAREWVLNYQSKKLLALKATVDDPAIGDTKGIHFTVQQIRDFIDEILCQKATGIKAYFCSVNPRDEPDSLLKKRLLLMFMLTIKIGSEETDFHIEDRDGYDERPGTGDFDTGNPCPPAYCQTMDLP